MENQDYAHHMQEVLENLIVKSGKTTKEINPICGN